MTNKISRVMQILCEALEIFVGIIVIVAIAISVVNLVPELANYCRFSGDTNSLLKFLEHVFEVVIGIEFLKMLCKPNSENIMETLIFLVARHMILGDTTAMEDFISVISVAILCVLRRYLHVIKENPQKALFAKGMEFLKKSDDINE